MLGIAARIINNHMSNTAHIQQIPNKVLESPGCGCSRKGLVNR